MKLKRRGLPLMVCFAWGGVGVSIKCYPLHGPLSYGAGRVVQGSSGQGPLDGLPATPFGGWIGWEVGVCWTNTTWMGPCQAVNNTNVRRGRIIEWIPQVFYILGKTFTTRYEAYGVP